MSIVQVSVAVVSAPAPETLQETGAFISQGGTTLSAGTYSLLTSGQSLTLLTPANLTLTSLSWSGGTVTADTTSAIPGAPTTGSTFITTIANSTPAGYQGTVVATVTGTSSFTYPLAVNPGAETAPGVYSQPGVGELAAMSDTFFGQGTSQSVYVLELGVGGPVTTVPALATFITANPGFMYGFLVPRNWDAYAAFLALLAQYEALTAKLYFWITTTTGNYTSYTALMKCGLAEIEAPGIPPTEFSLATAFQKALSYAPSSTNKMTQLCFSYLYGVTPYPLRGNQALLATLAAANINVVGTGAEGGISTAIQLYGDTLDGNDYTYWYSVDWIQINADTNVSNAIINGSNNPINPLYYNQDGINQLQDVLLQTVTSGVTYGLANGTVAQSALSSAAFIQALDNGTFDGQNVVNAEPFLINAQENPDDYEAGVYRGFTIAWVPQRGFRHVVISILVQNFVVAAFA